MMTCTPAWRQVLRGTAVALLVAAASAAPSPSAPQTFTVALPEMEGPLTLGVFSQEGRLVRLLFREASVDSLPAGLNGLIITWDEKDDAGNPVPFGTYQVHGLVHGPLRVDLLPFSERLSPCDPGPDPCSPPSPLPGPLRSGIVLDAAQDLLHTTRPGLLITAESFPNRTLLLADGLPLAELPFPTGPAGAGGNPVVHSGTQEGEVLVTVRGRDAFETLTVSGLDRIVPLDAGALEVPYGASQVKPLPGESPP